MWDNHFAIEMGAEQWAGLAACIARKGHYVHESIDSIDKFVDEAEIEMDPKKQKRLYAQAQIQLLKDLPAFPVRNYHFVFGRQKYIDLGYEPKQTMIYAYHITEKTKILAH